MLTADGVREALRVCFDPVLPVNIVDLGLVHNVDVVPDTAALGTEPRFLVTVQLLHRVHNDERDGMLLAQVSNRLAGIYAVKRSDVAFVDSPEWTSDRMSDQARMALGLSRPPKPGLVQIDLGPAR